MAEEVIGFFQWEAANPLLAGIPGEMTYDEMKSFLAYDPSEAWSGEVVPDRRRRGLAYRVVDLFVSVPRCVNAAQRIHQGLIDGLRARDPRLPRNRAAVYERAMVAKQAVAQKTPIARLPWFSEGAPGFVFSGSTGEGKSMLIERYLAGIPQVIVHPETEEYGWKLLKQLAWLKVSMPANGGRLGLLMEIVKKMDRLLGSEYERELRSRGTTIDVQLILVLGWLSIHCCGLLVIEEAQERTAVAETFGAEFLTYFLKILNWGIPTLLIGNPKALKVVESFVQDERRFAEAWVNFLPISDPEDPEWKDDLVPSIWSWRITKEPDQPIEDLHIFLWQRTGGHRAALALLRREANIVAIDSNSDCITKNHIIAGFHGDGFRKHQKYIASLIKQDLGTLQTYSDFPSDHLAKLWNDERKAAEIARRGKENEVSANQAQPPSGAAKPDANKSEAATAPAKKRAARKPRQLAPAAPQSPPTAQPPDPDKSDAGCTKDDVPIPALQDTPKSDSLNAESAATAAAETLVQNPSVEEAASSSNSRADAAAAPVLEPEASPPPPPRPPARPRYKSYFG